jgi:pseudo-rSAM protein
MQNQSIWFFIEPYVNLFLTKKKSILYNTFDGSYIEVSKESIAFNLIKRLSKKKNLYVTDVKKKELQNPSFHSFINLAKKKFIGDIIEKTFSVEKPVQIRPILKIINPIKGIANSDEIREFDYLHNLYIYLNLSDNNQINKQFLFCNEIFECDVELEFNRLKSILDSVKFSNISILGSDVLMYSRIENLIKFIRQNNIRTSFYINCLNSNINLRNLSLFKSIDAKLYISVSEGIDKYTLLNLISITDKLGISPKFEFKIEKVEDIEYFEPLIDEIGMKEYSLNPYYNGQNLNLFEEAVFLNKEDIFEAKPTQKDIFARQKINQLNFGKLFILPNGNVYSNLNTSKLGNLNKYSIIEMVHKEIYKKKNWFKLRKNVKPCKSCVYNLLCPPISNYEYAIGKYNLCHVWENSDYQIS